MKKKTLTIKEIVAIPQREYVDGIPRTIPPRKSLSIFKFVAAPLCWCPKCVVISTWWHSFPRWRGQNPRGRAFESAWEICWLPKVPPLQGLRSPQSTWLITPRFLPVAHQYRHVGRPENLKDVKDATRVGSHRRREPEGPRKSTTV